jgi:hypothetical protein
MPTVLEINQILSPQSRIVSYPVSAAHCMGQVLIF